MRIAFVSLETVHHRGTETNARLGNLATLLANRGHDVHVLCARWWDGDRTTFERDGITYHGVAAGLETCQSFALRLPFALRGIGPDVIHAGVEPPSQVLAASWGARLAKAPLVAEWYDDPGVGEGRVGRRAIERPDRIVTPSRLVRTWIRERGVGGDRIEVIPNPIDAERIRNVDPAGGADVVYARRLDEAANLESLLLALAELRDREWTATVIGDGPERERYEGLAADLRIEDRITFAGETGRDERIATYRGAHAFVHTARRCVFPTELLWALASGCVGVVEYHVDSSAHELVEGRDRGFRVTSEDELVDAIVGAGELEHREYDETFEPFDGDAVLDRYLREYRDLRGQRRRGDSSRRT